MSTPEERPEFEGGRVVPFPGASSPAGAPGVELEPAPEVLEAELVDPEPVVPVNPPPQPAPLPWRAGQPVRRPVIPVWLADAQQRRETGRWVAGYLWHTAKYHGLRSPWYLVLAAAHAPRGFGVLSMRVLRYVTDAEARPLAVSAVRRDALQDYLTVARVRSDRVRFRRIGVTLGLIGLTGVVIALGFSPWWVQLLAATVAILVLARIGRPADRPIVSTAVVIPQAPRLTDVTVTKALASVGIGELRKPKAITFAEPISRDGPGWRAVVELPHGVTAGDVIENRERLASGLRRQLGCVWPEPLPDSHPGMLVVWVGDKDMRKAAQPPWPLLSRGQASLFDPVPFGTDQRGRTVLMPLMYSNMLTGALPGAGKTMAIRIPLLYAALDPLAQLDIAELKGTGDLSALECVAHSYVSGVDDGSLELALEILRDVYADLPKRAKVIQSLPADLCPEKKVTPELSANCSLGLHPRVVAIDECQELFSHSRFKDEAEALATAIIKRGRSLGVIAIFATQRPDAGSLPKGISDNVGTRFCLRVTGQPANDMVLGTSMYKAGVRATMFTTLDLGIGYLVGAGPDPRILRTFYVDQPGSERITARARALREAADTLSGHAIGERTDRAPGVDYLGDVATVYATCERTDRPGVWSEELCARLAQLRPEVYRGWTPDQLATALRPYGLETKQLHMSVDGERANKRGIRGEHLRAALDARSQCKGIDRRTRSPV